MVDKHKKDLDLRNAVIAAVLTALAGLALWLIQGQLTKGDESEERARTLFVGYNEIGDRNIKLAQSFARTGNVEGSDQFFEVLRHFRTVASDIGNGRVRAGDLLKTYQGSFDAWETSFREAAKTGSPANAHLDEIGADVVSRLADAMSEAIKARNGNGGSSSISASQENNLRFYFREVNTPSYAQDYGPNDIECLNDPLCLKVSVRPTLKHPKDCYGVRRPKAPSATSFVSQQLLAI